MPRSKGSLADLNPALAAEWDYDRNKTKSPETVSCSSSLQVHWQCSKGHRWVAQVRTRALEGTRCPYCSRRKPSPEYNLATELPDIAAQWNYAKNGDLTPYDFLPAAVKAVWWICDSGHEWEVSINNRYAGNGCPYCSNRRVGYGNDLATTHPAISRDWHPTKKAPLTPSAFTAGSNRKVWWRCDKGHEWKAQINERTNGTGCPLLCQEIGKHRWCTTGVANLQLYD